MTVNKQIIKLNLLVSVINLLYCWQGGIQESFELKNMRTESQKNEIWNVLVKSRMHKSLIGVSIAPSSRVREARLGNGLVMGHAYTVTKIACVELGAREIKLVRVRNPW